MSVSVSDKTIRIPNPLVSDKTIRIPKVIYQTWKKKGADLHPVLQSVQQRIMQLNPEYEYRFFDDDDIMRFVQQEYDDRVYRAFCMLNVGAARADFWRYLVLYRWGGVYLDMDSTLLRPLRELIRVGDRCIISREGNPDVFLQWMLVFEPGHPILKTCIDLCVQNIEGRFDLDVFSLTGPGVFTNAVLQFLWHESRWENERTSSQIYGALDDEISCEYVRFFGVDFGDFASFKHPYTFYLYEGSGNMHWREDIAPLLHDSFDSFDSFDSSTSTSLQKPCVYFSQLGIHGRLGNVLFQYAAMKSVAHRIGGRVVFPTGIADRVHHGQTCLLTRAFVLNGSELESECDGASSVRIVEENCDGGFYDADFFNKIDGHGHDVNVNVNDGGVNIYGQFESELYFANVREEVQQGLRLKPYYCDYARGVLEKIRNGDDDRMIVGVHIRRGDDVTINQAYHTSYEYNMEFLKKAIARLLVDLQHTNIYFLMFSGGSREHGNENGEDIEWCKRLMHGPNVVYSEGRDTIHDFAVMSHCDHLILNSSSSIGWWAGYLHTAEKPKKNVIVAPPLNKSRSTYWPDCFTILD